ncbi:MAG: alpha/beta hydrolase family protein [Candidatus Hodarchaeota archaeon]
MSFLRGLMTRLPDKWQDKLIARVISSGKWKGAPTFQMLFQTMELMGGDRDDIVRIFSESKDLNLDFREHARAVASERRDAGLEAERKDDYERAIMEYQHAIVSFFLADWVTYQEELFLENYRDLLEVSETINRLSDPPVEQVKIPWENEYLYGRLRIPRIVTSSAGYPVIILTQGNDTVKETLRFIEEAALEKGIAILNIDQPGWGESRYHGVLNTNFEELGAFTTKCVDFLLSHPEYTFRRVGALGFSGGAMMAAVMASFDARLASIAMVGAALVKLDKVVKRLPAIQRRQITKHTGITDQDEIMKRVKAYDFETILLKINCPSLIVHGEEDSLAPVEGVSEIVKFFGGPVDLNIVPKGDHMCSDTLIARELPMIMDWFLEKL